MKKIALFFLLSLTSHCLFSADSFILRHCDYLDAQLYEIEDFYLRHKSQPCAHYLSATRSELSHAKSLIKLAARKATILDQLTKTDNGLLKAIAEPCKLRVKLDLERQDLHSLYNEVKYQL